MTLTPAQEKMVRELWRAVSEANLPDHHEGCGVYFYTLREPCTCAFPKVHKALSAISQDPELLSALEVQKDD